MDANGQVILEPIYDAIGEFKQYGYAVMQRAGQVGLLNRSGEEIVRPLYEDIKILDSTLIAVMEQERWQVINIRGELILESGYERVQVWDGGFLGFMIDGKWGMANAQGERISDPRYDEIKLLQPGYFSIRNEEYYGLLSAEGELIITPSCNEVRIYNDNFFLFRMEEHWGAVSRGGDQLLPAEYESMVAISDNFIKLVADRKVQLFSIAAQMAITQLGAYDNFYPFDASSVLGKKNRQLGLLDSRGDRLLTVKYNEIQAYNERLYRARYQNRWGLVAAGDEVLVPFEYDYIAPTGKQICIAKKGDRFGIINVKGEELVPFDYDRIELEDNKANAYLDEALTLYFFNKEGELIDESQFEQFFTIRIGGKRNRVNGSRNNFIRLDNNYQLKNFEWFYSPQEDRWGLRRLDDGTVHLEPSFDWIRIERNLGFTIVGLEKYEYYDFEWTKFRFEMVYGLVNNEKGLLVTHMNLWDVRLSDFDKGYPTARCVFSNGRHGLINRIGKIIKKDYAYIGGFHNGVARMSIKGRLSGSFKKNSRGLQDLDIYLNTLMSPYFMMDYTLYDQDFEEKAQLTCEDCKWGYIDTAGFIAVSPNYNFAQDFVNDVGIVQYKDKWGLVDRTGRELIPCNYDGLHFLENTDNTIIRIYNEEKKYGLIDTLGQVRVNLVYDAIGAFSDGRLAVKRNGLWGFVDKYGREVIPCRFRRVKNFSEGYAAVQLGRFWGFIDKQGDTAIDFQYKRLGNFKEGLAWVSTTKGTGYIGIEGQMVIPPKFKKGFDFEGQVARVIVNGKYGLIDKRGNFVLSPRYSKIEAFDKKGLAIVTYSGQRIRYGLMNKRGRVITGKKFKKIRPFKEGLAMVKFKDAYGYIDYGGRLVIDNIYSKAGDFSEGRAAVQRNGLCGYIDSNGDEVVELEYSKCLDFTGGKAVVYKGYRQGGIIDLNGNYVIEPSINRLYGFTEGRGLVRDSRYRFYYITEEAKLYEGYYDRAGNFQHGVAVVQSDGRWGIINQKGMEIIPPKYDKIEDFQDGYAKVRIKGFSGLTNLQGELIVQPTYEYISYAGEGLFRVEQGDKIGYFDSEGKWVWSLSE